MEIRPVNHWLNQILTGAIDMTDAPPAVQSWSRLFIHQGAVEIMEMENRAERLAALEKIPPKIRGYVKAEVERLWSLLE